MDVSVIISTYNSPEWLEKVIWGYACQCSRGFELVIADDGSRGETREKIESLREETGLEIQHQWHEDTGFRKCRIMNQAITASRGSYLIFSDGDCIPRSDFIKQHVKRRSQGRFLSGGYSKLSMDASHRIERAEIESGLAFDPEFLAKYGLKNRITAKHCARGWHAALMNHLTPTSPTWNGHNASAWKSDALAVNGFDERMVYGGEDREFGERLFNYGLKSTQIRYSAICIHLDHKRGYVTREGIDFNKSIRAMTKKSGQCWSEAGIVKGKDPGNSRI